MSSRFQFNLLAAMALSLVGFSGAIAEDTIVVRHRPMHSAVMYKPMIMHTPMHRGLNKQTMQPVVIEQDRTHRTFMNRHLSAPVVIEQDRTHRTFMNRDLSAPVDIEHRGLQLHRSLMLHR